MENPADIMSGLSVGIWEARTIAHKPTRDRELTQLVGRRKSEPRGQRDHLLPPIKEERGSSNQKRARFCAARPKRAFKLSLAMGMRRQAWRDKKTVHSAPLRFGPHAGAASTALRP